MVGDVPEKSFLAVVGQVVEEFIQLPENPEPERAGGYIHVREKESRKPILIAEVGYCRSELASRCFELCQEKANRLISHSSEGHISSWQSRDSNNRKYGGAIVAPSDSKGYVIGRNLVGSFSGFTEHGDEAVMLVIWTAFHWLVISDVKRITAISQNQLFEPLLEACRVLFE